MILIRISDLAIHKDCDVYFILMKNTDGYIKIGQSNSPLCRHRELQVGSPYQLEILATVWATTLLENIFHKLFASSRIRGEWFYPTKDIMECIAIIKTNNLENLSQFIIDKSKLI